MAAASTAGGANGLVKRLFCDVETGRQHAFDSHTIWQGAEIDSVAAKTEDAKIGREVVLLGAGIGKASNLAVSY